MDIQEPIPGDIKVNLTITLLMRVVSLGMLVFVWSMTVSEDSPNRAVLYGILMLSMEVGLVELRMARVEHNLATLIARNRHNA